MRGNLQRNKVYSIFLSCKECRLILVLLMLAQFLVVSTRGQMRQVFVDNVDADNEIRKISFYSPSQGYVAFLRWIGHTTDSGRTFVKKYITISNVNPNGYNVNITFGFGIKGVKAFGADTLIVYGDYGFVPAILYSTDQGNSFTLVYQSRLNSQRFTEGITDMVFPKNTNIGYAVEADRIIKTTNRGKTWFPVYSSANSFFEFVEAVDDNTIFAFSTEYPGKLVKSTNGGSNWQQMSVPEGQIKYAHFITASKGWLHIINDGAGLLYYTSNGGASWVLKNDPIATPFYGTKMKFTNDSTGYALSGSFTLYPVYKTTDSGKIWEPLPRDNNYEYLEYGNSDLHFWNNDQFWAGGGHGFLELSTNGGGTPLPKAYFKIDTTGVWNTSMVNLKNYSRPGYQYKWYVNDVLISTSYHASYTHALLSGSDSVKLVVTSGGLSDSITQYQYFNVPLFPKITSFTPATGSAGTMVTIYGSNFSDISNVQFGGTNASSFTIVSSTKITAIVGAGASGNVSLVHLYGTFSAPGFTYFAPPSSPPPVITSFSPASGPVGTVVTITGNNFDPMPANNIVYFGDTRASITAASIGQLTCTVPMGASHKPIFVLNNTTHLSAQSFKPFITTFADSGAYFTGKNFTQAFTSYYPNNTGIKCATSADMDNDGKTDIVATLSVWNQDTLVIYRNTTDQGSFSFADRLTVGPLMSVLSRGIIHTFDLDGDGLQDILGATNTADISVYRNTSVPGNISFAAPMLVPTNPGTQEVTASDLDGDGKPDLVATGITGNSAVSVVRNTSSPGNISFAPTINYPVNTSNGVAVGDIDNDGKNDIVVLSQVNATYAVSFFKNSSTPGNISFGPRTDITGGAGGAGPIMLADMDTDNKLDIVIKLDNDYIIGRNTGTSGNASFDFSFKSTTQNGNGGGVVESLSGDSRPDIVAGNSHIREFEVYLNTSMPGSIQQARAVTFAGREYASGTHAADFNNDGKPDVLIASWSTTDASLSVYKNGVGAPVDFSICSGSANIDVDISGSNYQWQQDNGSGFVDINDNSNFFGAHSSKLSFSNVPGAWMGYKYRCVVNGTYYSSTYKILNRTLPPSDVTISASATSICFGASVTFSASDNSGRIATSYRWQFNGIDYYTTKPIFTPNTADLTNNSQVRVIATLRDDCFNYTNDTSNVITMTVRGEPSSVTISTPATNVCSGKAVTFTATPVYGGGNNPAYQWQVNGVNAGTNSAVFTTSSLTNNSQVRAVMTSSMACPLSPAATSNTITVNVQNPVPPTVSIDGVPAAICPGGYVSLMAITTNGGNTLQYQWKKNGQNVGPKYQFYDDNKLVNGDVIAVEVTTYAACAGGNVVASNSVTIQVSPVVTPSINISGNAIVNKGQVTTLQATAVNAGTAPVYVWEDSTGVHTWAFISSSTMPTLAYSPLATGDKIRCQVISNAPCAFQGKIISTPITFTVNMPTAINPVPANSGLHIYPNPVTTTLVLDSLKLSDTWTTLEITSMSGTRMITQNISNLTKVEVRLEQLSQGMYIAVLRGKNGTAFYYKFVKM